MQSKLKEIEHTSQVRVRFVETDPLGIVWHGNYIQYSTVIYQYKNQGGSLRILLGNILTFREKINILLLIFLGCRI